MLKRTLPFLSALAARGEREAMWETLSVTLRWVFLVSCAAAAVTSVLSREVVLVVYQRGAFTIEDTLLPTPFGGGDNNLISIAEGVGKMRAAIAGRQDPRLVIVGRTSAIGITGVEDTIARLRAYEAVGVDMLFMAGGGRTTRVHGPFCSDDEVEQVVAHLKRQGRPSYLEAITAEEGEEEEEDDG